MKIATDIHFKYFCSYWNCFSCIWPCLWKLRVKSRRSKTKSSKIWTKW